MGVAIAGVVVLGGAVLLSVAVDVWRRHRGLPFDGRRVECQSTRAFVAQVLDARDRLQPGQWGRWYRWPR